MFGHGQHPGSIFELSTAKCTAVAHVQTVVEGELNRAFKAVSVIPCDATAFGTCRHLQDCDGR